MKHDYEYDDSGLASSYLALSILLPITLYFTYKRFRSKPSIKRYPCSCVHCNKNPLKKPQSINIFLVATLWTAISFLFKNIMTLKLEYKSNYFNPYRILDVDENASITVIKQAFRRAVTKPNPDAVPEEKKEEVTSKLKEIVRAFNFLKGNMGKSLRTETTYEVVAIPKWIIEKGYIVLLLYGIVVGIYLPKWALKKWNSQVEKNRFGVYYSTADLFYMKTRNDHKDIRFVINFVTGSRDFRERAWRNGDLSFLKQFVEDHFGQPLREPSKAGQGYAVLMDHLFRTRKADIEDLGFVQTKSIAIVNSLKEIAIRKNMISFLDTLFMFERMVVQAVFDPEFYLMQVPENDFESVFLKNRKLKELGATSMLPRVQIKNLGAFVEKTELVESDSRCINQNVYEVPKESRVTITFELERDGEELVHAPFLNRGIKLLWFVCVVVDNKFLDEVVTVFHKSDQHEFKFTFDAAENQPQSNVTVHAKSGEYFGIDQESSIILKYSK